MTGFKKIINSLLFPHILILVLLTPLSVALLVYAMVVIGESSPIAIISYVLSAYTLLILCVRIPRIISYVKNFKQQSKLLAKLSDDVHLRVKLSLSLSLLLNTAYSVFQLCLGIYHSSFWFYSLSAYYLLLALMRLFLVGYTRRHAKGEDVMREISHYRACGILFLFMNIALALMLFFMVYFGRTFSHTQITTIALAAYTFTAFITAIVNLIRYRKYKSYVYSASKAISLASACVSMLTLTSAMLTAFGSKDELLFNKLMTALVGAAVSVFVISMAIYMIVQSNKAMKKLKFGENNEQ